MQNIQKYLPKLKKEISRKEAEHKKVGTEIREVIQEREEGDKIMAGIKSWYIKKGTLYIETTAKAIAQEIYWKRDELKEKINQRNNLIQSIKVT